MASILIDGNEIYFRCEGRKTTAARLESQPDGSVRLWLEGRILGGRLDHQLAIFKDIETARRDATSNKALRAICDLWVDRISQYDPRLLTNSLVYDGRTYRNFKVTPRRDCVIVAFYNQDDPDVKVLSVNLDVDDAKHLVLLVNQALSSVIPARVAQRFFHNPEVQDILNRNPRTRQMMSEYLAASE